MDQTSDKLNDLSLDELRHRFDQQLTPALTQDMGRRTNSEFFCQDFDTRDEFIDAIRATGQKPEAVIAHEYAHGRTAQAVGVSAVRYSVEFRRYHSDGEVRPYRVVTRLVSGEKIPMIARLSINAAPNDPSPSDMEPILHYYGSLARFSDRVRQWNDSGHKPIPLPGAFDERNF